MRTVTIVALAVVSLFVLAACGGGDEEPGVTADAVQETDQEETTTGEGTDTSGGEIDAPFGFDLDPVAGSDVSGQVTITPSGGEEAEVEIVLDSQGAEGSHPAHIHEGTSCSDFNPQPAFPLPNVEDGTSSATIDVGVSELLDGDYVVNVHESNEELETYISCGEIPSRDEVLQGS